MIIKGKLNLKKNMNRATNALEVPEETSGRRKLIHFCSNCPLWSRQTSLKEEIEPTNCKRDEHSSCSISENDWIITSIDETFDNL